jgi:hypothetical protein
VSHASRTFKKFLSFQRDLPFFSFSNAFDPGAKKKIYCTLQIALYHY